MFLALAKGGEVYKIISMNNDYNLWMDLKYEIQVKDYIPPLYKTREVWWCHLGHNIGNEQNGKNTTFSRPILILRKYNSNLCLALPMSTKVKENPYYRTIEFQGEPVSVLISQARTIDTRRLGKKIGELSPKDFSYIKEEFIKTL